MSKSLKNDKLKLKTRQKNYKRRETGKKGELSLKPMTVKGGPLVPFYSSLDAYEKCRFCYFWYPKSQFYILLANWL